MNLDDFDFDLPPELIAEYPLADRSSAKLLIGFSKVDEVFHNIGEYFNAGDVLVLNNTKVNKTVLYQIKYTLNQKKNFDVIIFFVTKTIQTENKKNLKI